MNWEEGDRAYVDTKQGQPEPKKHASGRHYFGGHYWGRVMVLEVCGKIALVEGKIAWGRVKRAHIPTEFLRSAGDPTMTHAHACGLYSLYVPRFGSIPDTRLAAWNTKDIPEAVITDLVAEGLAERVKTGQGTAIVITLAGKLELRRYLARP